ncbi:MAG: FecR family protein, partial [Acholeplasmatales bacterium]|nr:FecR family protein [Acholeplasmatales bacterium]
MKKILIIIGSIVLAIGVALAIILPIVLNNGGPQEPDYRSIKAIQVTEEAYCKRDEKELAIYEGMNFRNNDSIKTKNNAYVVLKLDSDKYIYIGSNSDVLLKTSPYDSSKTIIRVNEGSIVTEVKNKLSDLEEFGVETPNSTMAIRGTTFQVEVIKKNNEYEINYRLIEGKIDVSVLESKDGNISVGVFSMNPMEEIKIVAEDSGIIDASNGLDDVLDKYRSKDSSIEIKNYESVDDYISKTTKVHLTKKELSLSDIASILDKVRFNYENGILRTIVINSTFDVYDNEVKVASNLVKYEDEKEYKIIVKAEEKEQKMVNGWKKSTFNNSGDLVSEIISGGSPLELEVSETMILEPIYQELTSKSFRIIPSNGAACSVSGNNLTEELNLEEGVVTLTATEQDGMIFMGWYEIDEDGVATLVSNRGLVLENYDIKPRLEAGVVSIQPRYITSANVASINSNVRKVLNNTLVNSNSLIHLKSGTSFDSNEYIVEVSDGIYKATLNLSECMVSFSSGSEDFDLINEEGSDGEYSFNISLLDGSPKVEIPLVVEPFTLTVRQPYVGTSITVNYYQEGIDGIQSVTLDNINEPDLVLENVLSYDLTFNIGDYAGLYAGFYDEYVSGKPGLVTDSTTYSGTIEQKVVISTRVLPKSAQTSTDKLYLYVYDKDDNKLDIIDMPFGKKFYLSDYVFKVKYDTYYPDELFEIPSSLLMYSVNDTRTNNNVSDSEKENITNHYGNGVFDFCFYAKDGAGTFIQTYRYLKVLPEANNFAVQTIDYPVTCELDGKEVLAKDLKNLNSGILTLKANKKEGYIFVGFNQADQNGISTLIEESDTITIDVLDFINNSIYAIVPVYAKTDTAYAELRDTDNNRIYQNDTFKLLTGNKFNKNDLDFT